MAAGRAVRRSQGLPFSFFSCVGCALMLLAAPLFSEEPEKDEPPEPAPRVTAGKKWTVLHRTLPKDGADAPLPASAPVVPYSGFKLVGPDPGHPFKFGNFESGSEWGAGQTGLHPIHEKDAALVLAAADAFDLEGVASAEGTGGWFFLLGWKEGHGYVLYNITMKQSGSIWVLFEVRDGKAVPGSNREVSRTPWKGYQPFTLSVQKNALQFKVGSDVIGKDVPLPNYHEGTLMLGMYVTKHGAKPLRVQSLRIRAK